MNRFEPGDIKNIISNHPSNQDTIAAISTPLGQGGIGIVRVSGKSARDIIQNIFTPKRPISRYQSHRLYLGYVINPSTGDAIDEVLLSMMESPNTYTGEDVAEINSHSGHFLLLKILQVVLDCGVRLAKPGEFTFRAFLNGRIDLTQAEAVIDLINAKSEKGLVMASRQIKGRFGDAVNGLRKKVIDALAALEAALDFPDDVDESEVYAGGDGRIERELITPIENLLAGHAHRKIWLEGLTAVIVGRVNAGKSSLLNQLLNEDRAIVTPIAGTTRDIIESTLHIEGLPVRLMDTAGFRKARGQIERIGVHRTEATMADGDLILVVVDGNRPLKDKDLDMIASCDVERSLVVLNKIDLPAKVDMGRLKVASKGMPLVRISALTGAGIDVLKEKIRERVLSGEVDHAAHRLSPNLRHKTALETALEHFRQASTNMRSRRPLEIIAVDLQSGLEALDEILGQTPHEAILDRIFSRFCIGK